MASTLEALANWLDSGDTGISSLAIVTVMLGGKRKRNILDNHPHDSSDLGRCIRLLDAIPEWRDRLEEMGEDDPYWAALVRHWAELETLYRQDSAASVYATPTCGFRLRRILEQVKHELKEKEKAGTPTDP